MTSKPVLIAAVVILTVFIAAVAIWTLSPNPQPGTPTTPSPTPKIVQSTGPCKDFEILTYLKYPISCKKAVEFALTEASGVVKKVSIGSVRTTVPSSSGPPERRTVDMWLIDIELAKPYFDDKFNKQINILQVGIRVEEHNVLYRKPLE